MAQLIPLALTVSCFSKIQIGFTFLVLAYLGSPRKRAVKRVCVCVCDRVTGDWYGQTKGVCSLPHLPYLEPKVGVKNDWIIGQPVIHEIL